MNFIINGKHRILGPVALDFKFGLADYIGIVTLQSKNGKNWSHSTALVMDEKCSKVFFSVF